MHILITSIVDLAKTTNSRLHHIIEYLVDNGHKITVISIRDSWKHGNIQQNQELISKITVKYITDKDIGLVSQKIGAMFSMNKILSGIDLESVDVHFSYNSLLLSYFVAERLNKYGVKTIYDLADDLPDMIRTTPHIPRLIRPFAGLFGKIMLGLNLKKACIVTITAEEFLTSLNISKYKHELLPNGVDLTRFKPFKRADDGEFVIGYVGALREWVDLKPLFYAVKEINNPKIKVVVVGGEEDLEQYKDLADELQINAMFTGNIPYNKVPLYISQMDVATIPFKKNRVTDGTCPLKLLEYMAMEKPVICSPLSEVERMVGKKVLYASNVWGWVNQITQIHNHKTYCKKLGTAGRTFVEEYYNWENICKRFELLMREYSKNGD